MRKDIFFLVLTFMWFNFSISEVEVSPYKSNTTTQINEVKNISPFKHISQINKNQWDVQFDYNLQTSIGSLGNAGCEFTGEMFYITKWNSNMVMRLNPDGTLYDSSAISGYTGPTGMRDLAFDGTYLYGGVAVTNVIAQIDPNDMSVVATITAPAGTLIRSIAYDPMLDGFWVSNWDNALSCIDRQGNVIATIQNTLLGKYGCAYDEYSDGGPFLWVFDQGAGQGTPQLVHQFDLNTLSPTGVTFDVTSVITSAGAAAIAGGLFVTESAISGFATLGGILQGAPDVLFGLELAETYQGPLNPFNLVTPEDPTTIVSFPGSQEQVIFNWDTASATARYHWIIYNSSNERIVDLPIGRFNTFVTTLSEWDMFLESLGVTPGEVFEARWDIMAYRNNPDGGIDSLSSSNGARNLSLQRGVVVMSPFNLLAPSNNSTILTSPFDMSSINFDWTSSGDGVQYEIMFASPTIASPAYIISASSGFETENSFVNSEIDSYLDFFGIPRGESLTGEYAVFAYAGGDTLKSVETYNLTFQRLSSGDVLVVYDSTLADCRIARDSVANNLSNMGVSFDVINRGSMTEDIDFSMIGYNKVVWIGDGTSTMGINQRTRVKEYLSSGTSDNKSKFVVYSEDIGWQHGRTGSTNLDLELCNDYLGFNYIADRPASGAAQGIVDIYNNIGATDSTIGTWPDVLSPYDDSSFPLYYFRGREDSLNAVGHITDNFVTASFGVDISSLRRAIDSPPGSPVTRLLTCGLNFLDGATGIEEENHSSVPTTFSLKQNYPNPFNPKTKIKYEIAKNGFVSLKIYDVLGREIKTLVNQNQNAGYYETDFDANNLTSGIYFYKLTTESFSEMKKMVLIK